MASNITTEEEFSQLAKLFYEEKHKLNIPEKVEHSIKLITTHKLDEALEILLDLKNNFEKGLQYDNNKQYELFSFDYYIESIIYNKAEAEHNNKKVLSVDDNFASLYYRISYIYVEKKEYLIALEYIKKALRWNPVSYPILSEYLGILINLNLYDEYINTINKLFKYVFTPEALAHCYRKLGLYYTEKKEFFLATALYQYSLQWEYNDLALLEMQYIRTIVDKNFVFPKQEELIDILKEHKIPIEADNLILDVYRELIENDMGNIGYCCDNIEEMFISEKPKKDLYMYINTICTNVIERNPKSHDAYYLRGYLQYQTQNYVDAITDLNKGIELNTNNEKAYYIRGLAKYNTNHYFEAIKDFNKVITLNPYHEMAYYASSIAELEIKNFSGAIKYLDKAIKLNPNNESYYSLRGFANLNAKKYIEAINDYDRAIEISPNIENYKYRGTAKLNLNRYFEAINDFNKIIELNPSLDVYILNAICYKNLEQYEEAIENLEKSLNIAYSKTAIEELQTISKIIKLNNNAKQLYEKIQTILSNQLKLKDCQNTHKSNSKIPSIKIGIKKQRIIYKNKGRSVWFYILGVFLILICFYIIFK